jgi:hypothetical protein
MGKKMIRTVSLKNKSITSLHYLGLWVFIGVVLTNALTIACDSGNKKSDSGGAGGSPGSGSASGSPSSGTSDGTKGDNDQGGFLQDSDFKQEKAALTKEQITQILKRDVENTVERFDGDDETKENDCTKKMDKNTKIEPQRISMDVNNADCEIEIPDSDEGLSVTMKMKGWSTCNKDAFSKLKVKDLKKSDTAELCSGGEMKALLNQHMKMTFKGKIMETQAALMTNDGKPCEFSVSKSEIAIKDGCMDFFKSSGDFGDNAPDYTIRATYKSVSGGFNKKYFSKGSVDLTINGWKGSIKFGSGEPKYTLTSPKGEKLSGSWKDLEKQSGKNE